MLLTTKLAAASGGLAVLLTAGVGIASAQPGVDSIVNTTCTYPQVIAALNAQSPALADQFESTPAATAYLRSLLAASPNERRGMVAQLQGMPGAAQYTDVVVAVANSCSNF